KGEQPLTRSLKVRWPALLVYSRIDPIEVQAVDPRGEPPWRADLASLPNVRYRGPRTPTAAAAFGLSAALAPGALALVVPLRRREEEPPVFDEVVETPPVLTPLELALAQLERVSGGDGAVGRRRRALELVAHELGLCGLSELELSARRLAWS